MNTQTTVEPVRRTIRVECSVEHAFRTFTEDMGVWWPLATHSVAVMKDGSGPPETVVLEPRAGGALAERAADGSEARWATVLVWEPPHRLVLDWQPGSRLPTEVEVRFTADGAGTRVELEHRGFERYGEEAEAARSEYANGWIGVLQLYSQAADS